MERKYNIVIRYKDLKTRTIKDLREFLPNWQKMKATKTIFHKFVLGLIKISDCSTTQETDKNLRLEKLNMKFKKKEIFNNRKRRNTITNK